MTRTTCSPISPHLICISISVSARCFCVLAVAKALLRNMAGLDSAASTSRMVDVFLEPFMTFLVGIFEMLGRGGMGRMWVFRVSVKCVGDIGIWGKIKGRSV